MMNTLTRMLYEGGYSCVIAHGAEIRTFTQRGITDLYDLLRHDASFLKEALVADKVVGKAAAALMILGQIKLLHTNVISQPALSLLQEAGIEVQSGRIVPFIKNRTQTDWCPLEKISYPLCSANEIFQAIEEFIRTNKNQSGNPDTMK